MAKAKTKSKKLEQPPQAKLMVRGLRLGFAVALVCIGITGLHTVNAAHEMRRLYGELGDLQRRQDALLEERSRLMIERGALGSLQTIESVAEAELDMQFPERVAQVLQ